MILAIIQARMSSTRLPGKVLMLIHGRPMICWVIQAAMASQHVDKAVVATSARPEDRRIIDFANNYVDVFPGDLNDVLDRFYQASLCYEPTHIVRLTGDCPLLFPQLIDAVIELHLSEDNDYTWNRDTWPSGFDVEVIKTNALYRAYLNASSPHDREHVTSYIRGNPDKFKIGSYRNGGGGGLGGKWSIDTMADYENVSDAFFVFKGLVK